MNQHIRHFFCAFFSAILAWLVFALIDAVFLHLGSLVDRLLFRMSGAEAAMRVGSLVVVAAAVWFACWIWDRAVRSHRDSAFQSEFNSWLVSTTSRALLISDPTGVITGVSEPALKLLEHSENLVTGRNVDEFLSGVKDGMLPDLTREGTGPRQVSISSPVRLRHAPPETPGLTATLRILGGNFVIELTSGEPGTVTTDHDRMRELLRNVSSLILALTPDGSQALWNDQLCHSFGWTPPEGLPVPELISKLFSEPEIASEVMSRFEAADGRPFSLEFTCPTGEKCVQTWTVLRLADGTRVGTGNDTTSEMESQRALAISEERYRLLIENMQDGLVVVNSDLKIEFANPGLCRIVRLSEGDIVGRSLRDFFSDSTIERLHELLANHQPGTKQTIEIKLTLEDGTRKVLAVTMTPILDEDRQTRGSFSLVSDVTEQVRSSQQLRNSEQRLEMALQGAADGIWDLEVATGNIDRVSYIPDHLGYGPDEIEGSIDGWKEILHPEDRDQVLSAFNAMVSGETDSYQSEHRLRTKDGQWRWILDQGRVVSCDEEGRPRRVIGIHKDIDEQKRAGEELARTTELFATVFEAAEDAIFIKNHDLVYTHVNPAMCRMFGRPVAELVGRSDRDLFGDPAARMEEVDLRVLAGETFRLESPRCINGKDYYFHIVKLPLRDREGNVTGICGIARDITDRLETERRLEESEEQFRLVAENSLDVITRFDLDLRYTYANPELERLLGISRSEIIGRSPMEVMDEPAVARIFTDTMRRVIETREPEMARVVIGVKGRKLTHEIRFIPEFGPDGEVRSILSNGRDITEQKRVEDALRRSEEQYRTLVDLMPDGIATTDADLIITYANPSFCRMLGYECSEVVGRPAALFLDNDNFWVLKAQSDRRSEGESGSYELTFKHRLGHDVITRVAPAPVRRISGMVQSSAIITDITANKLAEQALRDSQEYTRAVIENSPLGITVRTPRGRLLDYNQAWQRIWDLDEEWIAREMSDKCEGVYAASWREGYLGEYLARIWKVYQNGGSLYLPDLRTDETRPGRALWVSHYLYAIEDEHGAVDRVVTITEDITARKLAEEALRDSEEFSRAVIDNSPIGITVRSATGRLLTYNQAWQRLWNIPDDDISLDLSRERPELAFDTRDTYLAPFQEDIRRVYEHGGNLFLPEIRTTGRREGSAKWVSSYFYAITDQAGRVDRVVVLTEDITARKEAEDEREQLIGELRTALADITTLRGLLPICAHCKKIRDDQGYWNRIEAYISQHTDVSFSHGICPECAEKYYPGVKLYSKEDKEKVEHEDEPNPDELTLFD